MGGFFHSEVEKKRAESVGKVTQQCGRMPRGHPDRAGRVAFSRGSGPAEGHDPGPLLGRTGMGVGREGSWETWRWAACRNALVLNRGGGRSSVCARAGLCQSA